MVNILKILSAEPTTITHHSGMNKDESKTEIHIHIFSLIYVVKITVWIFVDSP